MLYFVVSPIFPNLVNEATNMQSNEVLRFVES